ncbi:GNAT family N-acetyltransferase [Gemmobacter denitrificans]|uniref:GNAT family N-acetyltransferase n=1 Tax=Gemmobacter denitrificans TaxID=3123040 RepID=A0ABU8BWE0_9RHOB
MIRPATPEDAGAIRRCAEAAFAPYVPLIGRRPAPMDTDFPAAIAAGQVWLAERGGELAGYLICRAESEAMLLDTVAVLPRWGGQGIGRALIRQCEALACAAGLPAVRLYTNALMTQNLQLYPHLGYAITGRRQDQGFDRVFFEKRLCQGQAGSP